MTRQWWIVCVVGLALLIGVSWVYDTAKVAYQLPAAILNQNNESVTPLVNHLLWRWQPLGYVARLSGNEEFKAVDEFVRGLPLLLGLDTSRHYIVLFQNNMELRPTGGFIGSYADVMMKNGKLTDMRIQDIYVPDGQIKGYVPEPLPIKKYLFNNDHPGWRLRDANWNPDFPTAIKAIDWFMKEGGVSPINGYITVDLELIKNILQKTGPIQLVDYQGLTVTADTFYQEAQRRTEQGFFPGSTQKADFLGTVGNTLLTQLSTQPNLITSLLPAIIPQLKEKHVGVAIPDALGDAWHQMGWDGSVRNNDQDYLMITEANMGMTKANCCIDRTLSDTITLDATTAAHELKLWYGNNNPPKPQPPYQWGGGYKNYLRLFVPEGSMLSDISINGTVVTPKAIDSEIVNHKQSYGLLVQTEGGTHSTVVIRYRSPLDGNKPYTLFIQKQAGIEGWPVTITIINRDGISRPVISEFIRSDSRFSN